MPRTRSLARSALLLSTLLPTTLASPHGGAYDTMSTSAPAPAAAGNATAGTEPANYFRHDGSGAWIYGHIFLMSIAWIILLPLSAFLSVARSRLTLTTQLAFFATNAAGLALGTVYNARTPDLYLGNAHHRAGWAITLLAGVWIAAGVVDTVAQRLRTPVSAANMARYTRLQGLERRWSGDSGHGASEEGVPSLEEEKEEEKEEAGGYADVELEEEEVRPVGRFDRFVAANLQRFAVGKTLVVNRVVYVLLERCLAVLGFVALTTGVVTFGGLFRGNAVFNGLAHWIKGGIFFWYGLITLGRWMGSFADLGWAWNVRPSRSVINDWRARVPSAEFVESAVICTYGASNVFMEHLAAWGDAWSAQDFEHVSITVLFFGGGLLGMLIESTRIRELLAANLLAAKDTDPSASTDPAWSPPPHYAVPLNPLPALVILLLGLMMSSHTQESMVSSMIHAQWGNLFVGYALARAATYILLYIRPPVSHLPARPPSELVAAFCLTAGGAVFMVSARDVVAAVEGAGLDAMFVFTVGMGGTAMVMAWVVVLGAVMGAARRWEAAKSVGL
ncbi:hypothetical protein EJ06DRAFT_538196 [Trichodelitschia bisporula]|uniref:Integral membrane protein n=1 Tax=Trichodelitschia bisporula TaxID=703511 RepID=A0A6G1HVD9_9PEZI|nr:hypothetical protein EJ06DRAFT_538196 [Trichodelitschia bisporula]